MYNYLSICSFLLYSQAAIARDTAHIVEELKAKYYIGKCSVFPDRHIYQHGSRFWELDGLRLQIWAVAIVCVMHIPSVDALIVVL
jgi:hypothetical protein